MAHGALVAGCRSVHGCDVGDSAMGGGESLGGVDSMDKMSIFQRRLQAKELLAEIRSPSSTMVLSSRIWEKINACTESLILALDAIESIRISAPDAYRDILQAQEARLELEEYRERWQRRYKKANDQLADARETIKEQRSRIGELERLVERITGHAPAEYESIIRDMEGTNND